MYRYLCNACRMGMHDSCRGREAPPPGHFRGSECVCDGKCGQRTYTTDRRSFVQRMLDAMRG